MYRWRFSEDRRDEEEQIDGEITVFPVVSNDYRPPYRYSFNVLYEKGEWLFRGLKRYDMFTRQAQSLGTARPLQQRAADRPPRGRHQLRAHLREQHGRTSQVLGDPGARHHPWPAGAHHPAAPHLGQHARLLGGRRPHSRRKCDPRYLPA